MDVNFFLKERTTFIRQLYNVTSAPYIERIQKIENKEAPFVSMDSGDESDGEPPFQREFNEAVNSLDTLRLMYVSMLMSALHSFFMTWIKQSGMQIDKNLYKGVSKKKGWFWDYSRHFNHHFNINFDNAPVNLKIIEELILARNNIEHKSSISGRPKYSEDNYKILNSFTFTDKFDNDILQNLGFIFYPFIVHITEDQLLTAISTIEEFSEWFSSEIEIKIYPLRAKNLGEKS
jgi:hypothetical protein